MFARNKIKYKYRHCTQSWVNTWYMGFFKVIGKLCYHQTAKTLKCCMLWLLRLKMFGACLNTLLMNYTIAILIGILCMTMSIGILEKRVPIKFSLQLTSTCILYCIWLAVTLPMWWKRNQIQTLYTILSKHLVYEGFFKVIKKLCYCQTVQNTPILHAIVVAS